ncbi:MAG: PQQ-binding-like beta-propeller repeat protein [Verrucomicrobia bacterium]|nr:PQQ-binding-like beta-propeller repeat protein [Verrucomicrobiota bacterium]
MIRWLWGLLLIGLWMQGRAADTWPQWRGPTRDGQVSGPAWPETLQGAALTQRWQVSLEPGYSGPIVTPDRVFTTETVDKKLERVRALDRTTGRELWRQEWEGAMSVPFFARSNGDWIRATPAWDGETLYVAGMRDVLVALDAQTGAVRWRKDFVEELKSPVPAFGFVSSPLVVGDALYVQAGGGVMRLEKATGKIVWRSLESTDGMMGSAFSSPMLATVAGRPQLIVQTRTELVGLNPESGAVLWQQPVEAFRGMNILTPTAVGNRIFTSAYGGKTLAYDIQETNGSYRAEPAWEFKAQGYMTSPVIVNGFAYLHLRNQRALCINVATGQEQWTTGDSFGKYWSLVAQGDRILALDQKGELLLLRANPEKFTLIDRRKVSEEESWAHVAVVGEDVYIRDLKGLTAWVWSATPAKSAAR